MAPLTATMHARPGDARQGAALPVNSRRAALARRFSRKEDNGFANLSLVWVLIGFIIVVTVVAKMIPSVFDATADVNTALTDDNVTTGDESADAIKPVFGIVIGLAVVLGIVSIVLAAAAFKNRK